MLFPFSWFGRPKEIGLKSPTVKTPAGSQHPVRVGRNQLGQTLKAGKVQSVQDLECQLEKELPKLLLRSPSQEYSLDSSYEDSVVSSRGTGSFSVSSKTSTAISPKKSVTFNKEIEVHVFERAETPHSGQVAPAVRDLEAHMRTSRSRVWSMKHWADVLSSSGVKEGARGVKQMQALIQELEDSPFVTRARELFDEARSLSASSARNPLSDLPLAPGLVFDSEDLIELEITFLEMRDLWAQLKPERSQLEKQVNSLKINARQAMSATKGTEGAYEQRALHPIELVDDPLLGTLQQGASTHLSSSGEETVVTSLLAPVLMWGEFLAALDYAKGSRSGEIPRNMEVVALRSSY
ncbi:hypothetical protein ABIE13_003145 [Ottowia thiooxydans]|uniref:Uncharacterized protein n=2 Tax=Ottowia thiooxydans TaxID=219182 RepID=A0ABV2QAH1_9BURK